MPVGSSVETPPNHRVGRDYERNLRANVPRTFYAACMSDGDRTTSLDPNLEIGLEPSIAQRLLEWQHDTGYRLDLDEWLTEGNTKAKVAVVLASGPKQLSKIIIKACPPDRLTAREPRLHTQALAESPPDFVSQHLVSQPFETIESSDKWRLLFQSIAGDSLRQIKPLAGVLHDDRLPRLVGIITKSLLVDWNVTFDTQHVEPQVLLKRELGSKADRNGPLIRFLRDQTIENESWVRFAADPRLAVPNAIQWSINHDTWPDSNELIWAHFGHVHGDLHPGNVLIRIAPEPDAHQFRLIDMSCYSPAGSLARDLNHLGLSILNEYFLDTAARRAGLMSIALGEEGGASRASLELHGLSAIFDEVRQVAGQWQSSMNGMRDDWEDQMSLALVTEALEFVGRSSLPMNKRIWFFELACVALGRYLERHNVAIPPADPARVHLVGAHVPRVIENAVEKLLASCDFFSGARSVICVFTDTIQAETAQRAATYPWVGVMSFDADLDTTGALKIAREKAQRLNRLVAMGQAAKYANGSTTWFALGGLSDRPETIISTELRAWRRAYKKTLDDSLSALAKFSPHPVTLVIFGEPDGRVRIIAEAVDDRFSDRAQIVLVNDGTGDLGGFVDVYIELDPREVIEALPAYEPQADPPATVPGHRGPLILDQEDNDWIRELADIVDQAAGAAAGDLEDVGRGFLRGRMIAWFELSLNLDVVPRMAESLFARILEEIDARDTRRISLLHYPGAGGTTLARRAAWEMHREVPTLYCSSIHDEHGLAQRVSRLSQITGLPVLVVLEQATDLVADRFYNRLRGDSIPAVLLIVSRRNERPQGTGSRSFYLGPATTAAAVADLAERYSEYVPHRKRELASVKPGQPTAVPFYFGLLAFEDEYEGIEDYVSHSVANTTGSDDEILLFIALIHRYAGVSVAGDLFAEILNVSADRAVQLERSISDAARGLLIEDEPGFWRTAHWLVAAEMIRQLLRSATGDQDAWRLGLSSLATRVIDQALQVFGPELPDDIRAVLDRLFIVRENREQLDEPRPRSFSELLEDIPSLNGRLEVLRHLAESFPQEPHYWAHYGRLLSYEVGDTRAALDALNKALLLDENDGVLYHIRGMVYRRQLREFSQDLKVSGNEEKLLRSVDLALADFAEAARLKDDSEYPHVASVQVAVAAIDVAYARSGCASHSEFFSRPTSAPYRLLLERAENAMDAIAEIRGGDQGSARADEASLQLAALYDDYSALLQGWRHLLDRQDVYKAPIRRQLVRAYCRRAGSWSALRPNDLIRVRTLLEENLRDDPTDSRSLRDWLRVARMGETSLDRASELVSYWASQSDERDALYYDYVLSALQVIEGRASMLREAQRKTVRCRERASTFGNRKFSYEWLGHGSGLGMLIHYSDVPESWDRNDPDSVPIMLRRLPARVSQIGSPQAGTLRLNEGLDAFFVPARAGVLRNRHENARVEAVIGFSYDGLRAWSVRLVPGSTSEP